MLDYDNVKIDFYEKNQPPPTPATLASLPPKTPEDIAALDSKLTTGSDSRIKLQRNSFAKRSIKFRQNAPVQFCPDIGSGDEEINQGPDDISVEEINIQLARARRKSSVMVTRDLKKSHQYMVIPTEATLESLEEKPVFKYVVWEVDNDSGPSVNSYFKIKTWRPNKDGQSKQSSISVKSSPLNNKTERVDEGKSTKMGINDLISKLYLLKDTNNKAQTPKTVSSDNAPPMQYKSQAQDKSTIKDTTKETITEAIDTPKLPANNKENSHYPMMSHYSSILKQDMITPSDPKSPRKILNPSMLRTNADYIWSAAEMGREREDLTIWSKDLENSDIYGREYENKESFTIPTSYLPRPVMNPHNSYCALTIVSNGDSGPQHTVLDSAPRHAKHHVRLKIKPTIDVPTNSKPNINQDDTTTMATTVDNDTGGLIKSKVHDRQDSARSSQSSHSTDGPASGYVISGFQILPDTNVTGLESIWKYWSGARLLFTLAPPNFGLGRMCLYRNILKDECNQEFNNSGGLSASSNIRGLGLSPYLPKRRNFTNTPSTHQTSLNRSALSLNDTSNNTSYPSVVDSDTKATIFSYVFVAHFDNILVNMISALNFIEEFRYRASKGCITIYKTINPTPSGTPDKRAPPNKAITPISS